MNRRSFLGSFVGLLCFRPRRRIVYGPFPVERIVITKRPSLTFNKPVKLRCD